MALTPEQFNILATKEDLKDLEERLASKSDVNRLINTIDSLVK